jgi:hypothetical protein
MLPTESQPVLRSNLICGLVFEKIGKPFDIANIRISSTFYLYPIKGGYRKWDGGVAAAPQLVHGLVIDRLCYLARFCF